MSPQARPENERRDAQHECWPQGEPGALQQRLLAGNSLPERWQGQERFTLLDTGFGLGHHFLALWRAWLGDPAACGQLTVVALAPHPPSRAELQRAHGEPLWPSGASPQAQALIDLWPPLTANLHVLDFEQGRVRLLLAVGGPAHSLLTALQLQADALVLDGLLQAQHPHPDLRRMLKAVARLAAPGATATASSRMSPALRDGLRACGFSLPAFEDGADRANRGMASSADPLDNQRHPVRVDRSADKPPDRSSDPWCARFEPHFVPRRAPARQAALASNDRGPRDALIIGGGLAGTQAARALARTGWRCTVLDRHMKPAQEASGNPGGLFHGTAHATDGLHARFTRAAALLATVRYRDLVAVDPASGEVNGLLRLMPSHSPIGLPADYVQTLTAERASALAHCVLPGEAWLYPGGGWMSPAAVCWHALQTAGVQWQGGGEVARLERRGERWHALDAQAQPLAEARIVVCATGAAPPPFDVGGELQLSRVRGQVSWIADAAISPVASAPALPLSGHGYALRLADGRLLFGATSQAGNDDASERLADHQFNLERLLALCGLEPTPEAAVHGRVGWRATTGDRLPLIGAWPVPLHEQQAGAKSDQCRLIPRVPGLFVLMGLASRGLTWGPLAGETLAAWVNGTPMPLEADLLDAVDPARVRVRRARQATMHRP